MLRVSLIWGPGLNKVTLVFPAYPIVQVGTVFLDSPAPRSIGLTITTIPSLFHPLGVQRSLNPTQIAFHFLSAHFYIAE